MNAPAVPRRLKQFMLKPTVFCYHRCPYCDPRQDYYRDMVAGRKKTLPLAAGPASRRPNPGHMPLEPSQLLPSAASDTCFPVGSGRHDHPKRFYRSPAMNTPAAIARICNPRPRASACRTPSPPPPDDRQTAKGAVIRTASFARTLYTICTRTLPCIDP